MVICFNCSAETKALLDILLKSGQYKDYSEIISVAVSNLAVLEQEGSGTDVILINSEKAVKFINDNVSDLDKPVNDRSASIIAENIEISSKSSNLPSTTSEIPDIFLLNGLNNSPPKFAKPPSDVWVPGQRVTLDRWILGQYNKLLPAKVSCRGLAHLLIKSPSGVDFVEAREKISSEAVVLGKILSDHDLQNQIGRDDATSTAFPVEGENLEKSRARYANQFVANKNKHGQVSGLLIDLKLINYTVGKNLKIQLTEKGWHFATLKNPVLESQQEIKSQKFSQDEIDFLLHHIMSSVPAEDFAFKAILAAINEEANTPDTIDAALEKYIPNERKATLSKSFLASQRSGTISRMTDLNLIERIRDGVRVSYVITEQGNKYLTNKL